MSDLTPLAGLSDLKFLDLDSTEVRDLRPLAGLVNLEVLSFQYTQVSDLTPLAGLVRLRWMDSRFTPIDCTKRAETVQALESFRRRGVRVTSVCLE